MQRVISPAFLVQGKIHAVIQATEALRNSGNHAAAEVILLDLHYAADTLSASGCCVPGMALELAARSYHQLLEESGLII